MSMFNDSIRRLLRTVRSYIDAASDWDGEYFVFMLGDNFIDELRNRLNSKELYTSWIAGKRSSRQLSFIEPLADKRVTPVTQDDEKESILIRQVIRVRLNQPANEKLLAEHGWTVDDAKSLAQKMRPAVSVECRI